MPTDEPHDRRALRLMGLRGLVARLGGARLCFGEPVQQGDRTVIPVARVYAAGGGGYGSGSGNPADADAGTGEGGGGGGALDAAPVGFIEIGPQGTRFEAIPDPGGTARALRLVVATAGKAAVGLTAARQVRRRQRASRRSPRRSLRR